METPVSWPKQLHLVLGAEEAVVRGVMEKYLLMEKPTETGMDKVGRWIGEKFPLQAK